MKKSTKSPRWQCPEPIWELIKAIAPTRTISYKGGRPPADLRKVVDGIFYVLKTGIVWKDMPPCFASSSTCHRYFQQWQELGIFQVIWSECLSRYDDELGIDWSMLNVDSSQAKAPLGGEKNRAKPSRQRQKRVQTFTPLRRKRNSFGTGDPSIRPT